MRAESELNNGWWTSTLYPDSPAGSRGNMYLPMYFIPDRGLALHGSLNTEAGAASHGCIRTKVSAQEVILEAYKQTGSLLIIIDPS